MSRLVDRLHDIGALAWLKFVQALNWIAVSLFGSILVVHQAYPGVMAGYVSKLPPTLGIPLIIGFGLIVHYAIRRAKKDGGQ